MRIFFMCPDNQYPIGGVYKIYQQTDLLNANGYEAYVVHTKEGFRCNWFENTTKIAYPRWPLWQKLMQMLSWKGQDLVYPEGNELSIGGKKIPAISSEDIVVVPEYRGFELYAKMGSQPFVIFNQNVYMTFMGAKEHRNNPYKSAHLKGVMVVSQDSFDYLKFSFPNLPLYRIRLSVESGLFTFTDKKKKQIAYMPRKNPLDAFQIIEILKGRGNLNEWEFVEIDQKPIEVVAKIFKESAIYLNIVYQEGFGLPAFEAMLCGCVVIGNNGQGGREYFHKAIEAGNVLEFAKMVETVALEYDKKRDMWMEQGRKESEHLQSIYNENNERSDILNAWKSILSMAAL